MRYVGWGMVPRQVDWQLPYSLVTSELLWLSLQKDKTRKQPCCNPESFLCFGGIVVSTAAFQKAFFECCLLPSTRPMILSPVSLQPHYLTLSWPPPLLRGRNFNPPALQAIWCPQSESLQEVLVLGTSRGGSFYLLT